LAKYLFGYSFVPYTRSVLNINKFLGTRNLHYNFYGFEILLPSFFPLLRDKVNLVKYSNFLQQGAKNNKYLKYFGSKLLYVINVPN